MDNYVGFNEEKENNRYGIYKNMTQRKFQFAVVYYHNCGPSGIYSMTVEENVAKSLMPIQ